MKKYSFASCAIIAAAMISSSQAALILYDGFNYTTADIGTQGWTNANTGDLVGTTAGSLSVSGLNASVGNKVEFSGTGIDPQRIFTTVNSGTVYFSLAMQVTSLGSLNTTGGYFAGLGASATTFSSTLWTRSDGAGFDIGFSNNTTAPGTNWSSGTTSLNTTQFIVASFNLATDVASIWINPSSSTFNGTAPAATFNLAAGSTRTSLDRIFLRQDGTTATPFLTIDEVRVGDTWASVTIPEPSTYAAFGLGALGLLIAHRSRRKVA